MGGGQEGQVLIDSSCHKAPQGLLEYLFLLPGFRDMTWKQDQASICRNGVSDG